MGSKAGFFLNLPHLKAIRKGIVILEAREQTDSKLPDLFSAEFVATQASL